VHALKVVDGRDLAVLKILELAGQRVGKGHKDKV
jgi:hypothetical protein